jgi:hypothetical protein
VFKEAEMKCSNAREMISKKLRDACNMPRATFEQVLEVYFFLSKLIAYNHSKSVHFSLLYNNEID